MTYLGLACCLALIAFGAASALASLLLAPVLRRALARRDESSEVLFALRFSPTLAATLFVGVFFLPAFLRHEPRPTDETVTPALIGLAMAAALVLVMGPLRGLLSILGARRLARRWAEGASEVVLPGSPLPALAVGAEFPLVAVVGILRPRLFVARRVLERCTADEIAAIVAHETGHVLRRDNLRRLLLCSCPDLLAFSPLAPRFERAWTLACDRAADDHAAQGRGRLTLAAALVKVARLARPRGRQAPVAALCEGDGLAHRVRRLLEPERTRPGFPAARRRLARAAAIAALLLPAAIDVDVLRRLHDLTEAVVRILQ